MNKLQIEYLDIEKLIPYVNNPRDNKNAIDKVAASIKEFGFKNPILIDKDMVIIAGHTRIIAAKKLGMTELPIIRAEDLTPTQVKAYRIADNKLAEFSEWSVEALGIEFEELKAENFDLSLTGFDLKDINDLYNTGEAVEDEFDIDKAKTDIEADGTVTQRGDVWLLGNHRLMCGDSTSAEDMEKLMDGTHAQCTVTSPPYGVGKEYEMKGITPWIETIKPVIKNICKFTGIVCWNLGDLYATGGQFIEPTSVYSVNMFADNGFKPIWIRIWKKQGMNFGVTPYHLVTNKPVQQYEYISAFSESGEVEEYNDQEYVWLSAFAGHSYKFVKRLTKEERKRWGYAGIWEMTTVRANKEHPAMFPVELPWRCIKMHADIGGIVLEPFSGSGTTIIAAEQTERYCYAMELSPVYCDLAVRRWEEFTSEKAVKNGGD